MIPPILFHFIGSILIDICLKPSTILNKQEVRTMAYSFVIGDTQVRPEEYHDKLETGELSRFRLALAARSRAVEVSKSPRSRRSKPAALDFSTGTVTDDGVLAARKDSAPDFQPVGIGKPLSIEIAGIFTGDAPSTALGQPPDLLVASAVKSLVTYDAAHVPLIN